MANEIVDLIKTTPNILGELYSDLAQPSVKAIGNALGTVLEFSTSFLLPVKLLNEKFKLNFQKRLNEYGEKLEQVEKEKQTEVHTQIGTPIMEKLSYTTNDEIADLFTTLLANASNIDMVHTVHPAFVNMIARMSPDEAKLLVFFKGKDEIEYCNFKGNKGKGKGFKTILSHAILLPNEDTFIFPKNINAYLANFVSMGVLKDNFGISLKDKTKYKIIREQYGFNEYENALVPKEYESISVDESFFEITDFGKLFIKACVK